MLFYKEHIKSHSKDAEYLVAEFKNVVSQQRSHEMDENLSRGYQNHLPALPLKSV